ncbi:YqaI family protein [Heyndrickxia sp. MSNUG]|uniref:YqaI family protein n=1 Tax=Heyndrickxia sp. MSNUG TaxID=3136677 RepID=UPI003C2E75CA
MEHPAITRTLRTGYPTNVIEQPEHCGTDYFDSEILEGDDIIIDGEEQILKENLERYLKEVYGMQFQTIK